MVNVKPSNDRMSTVQAAAVYFTLQENWNRGKGGISVEFALRKLRMAEECTSPSSKLHRLITKLKWDIIENNVDPVDNPLSA